VNEKAFAERMAARKEAEAALIVDAVTRQLGGDPDRLHIYQRPVVEFNHMADRVLHGCDLRADHYAEVRRSIVGANQAKSASNQVYPPGRHLAKLQRRLP
jgi:hypothetical protein